MKIWKKHALLRWNQKFACFVRSHYRAAVHHHHCRHAVNAESRMLHVLVPSQPFLRRIGTAKALRLKNAVGQ